MVARRRAAAARERERLADALRDTPFSFPAGQAPRVARPTEHDGAAIAAGLAAQRIYVTPGERVGRRAATCASRCATAPPRPTGSAPRCAERLTRNAPRMNGCTRQKYV